MSFYEYTEASVTSACSTLWWSACPSKPTAQKKSDNLEVLKKLSKLTEATADTDTIFDLLCKVYCSTALNQPWSVCSNLINSDNDIKLTFMTGRALTGLWDLGARKQQRKGANTVIPNYICAHNVCCVSTLVLSGVRCGFQHAALAVKWPPWIRLL